MKKCILRSLSNTDMFIVKHKEENQKKEDIVDVSHHKKHSITTQKTLIKCMCYGYMAHVLTKMECKNFFMMTHLSIGVD